MESFQDGQSYRTRILSFRSTNDRTIYSTRKSLNTPGDSLNAARGGCYCYRDESLSENGFNIMRQKELNPLKYYNMDGEMNRRRTSSQRYEYTEHSAPLRDDRVTELYIFPHSNIVEFTDTSCDDKV